MNRMNTKFMNYKHSKTSGPRTQSYRQNEFKKK